ncbi:MAG: oligosaccharide repeat unit polymerase [Arcobacter sp.]|nr:oligosaccharide repeat unit polymerase [Arcobacter sp.]
MSQIEFLVFNYFITPIPVSVLLIYGYISYGQKKRYQKLFLISLFTLAFLFVAPTSVARFLAITLYLAILLRFTQMLEKRYVFQIGSIFGLMIVMPFLDKFRHFDVKTFDFSIDFTFLSQGHFDAYQNFVRLLSIDYISYGNQLLGALFFYIPRSMWADKPIGSGSFVASLGNLKFDNVSMPFIGEGYINFSILGSVIFMMLLGMVSGKLDKYYWSLRTYIDNHWFFNIYYLSLGMSFFILRGDLMSSFAYTVTIVGTYMALMYLIYLYSTIKIRGN